jgi:hypothetical protein
MWSSLLVHIAAAVRITLARLNDELAKIDWTWGQRNNLGGRKGVNVVFAHTKQSEFLPRNQYVIVEFGKYLPIFYMTVAKSFVCGA